MKLLDLFCGEGGAGEGYARAGFEVTGVDIRPQPNYPHKFVQADAFAYLREHAHEFDAIHASPPCRAYSALQVWGRQYFDFIPGLRELLIASGKPYIIENVEGAPLEGAITLCGMMFGIRTYRHRLFESNVKIAEIPHPAHTMSIAPLGREAFPEEYVTFAGNFSGVDAAREIMDMPWASRKGLANAVPPVYAEYLGAQLMVGLAP